jgi:hypothetical protein
MPGRPKNILGPLVLFHGCDKDVAEAVLSGQATLQPSENDYDWLGNGIYFWVDSPERALSWANLRRSSPSVIGAFAYPGNCLNLTDYGVWRRTTLSMECLKKASWFIRVQAFVTERMCRSPSATRR